MATPQITQLTTHQRETFARDGVVKVPAVIDDRRVNSLLEVVDRELQDPGAWVSDTNAGATTNRLFTTRYLWRHDPVIRDFIFNSGVGSLVGDALGAESCRFYFDHLLVKEPSTTAATPWHQDIPYWPFLGRKIGSAWVALTSASVAESSLEFVRGSHAWNAYFAPKAFDGSSGWMDDFEGEEMPDIDATREDYDIIGFDVEPGDVLIFSAWILHGSPGNAGSARRAAFSTRWLGEDSTWAPHPGSDPTVTNDDVSVDPGSYPADDDRFPLIWSRG